MKKFLMAGTTLMILFGMIGLSKAEEMRGQFRLWKSSFLDGSSYSDIMLTSAPIIVHSIDIATTTINNGGTSFFAMYGSTGPTANTQFVGTVQSTRIYCTLDNSQVNYAYQHVFDIKFSSASYYIKQGGSKINILWDWYRDDGKPSQQGVHVND